MAGQKGQCKMYHCMLYINVMEGKKGERGVRGGIEGKVGRA